MYFYLTSQLLTDIIIDAIGIEIEQKLSVAHFSTKFFRRFCTIKVSGTLIITLVISLPGISSSTSADIDTIGRLDVEITHW